MSGRAWIDYKPAPPTGHNDLADDLAMYLRVAKRPSMTWRNFTFSAPDCLDFTWAMDRARLAVEHYGRLDPKDMPRVYKDWRDCRPDVLAIRAQINPRYVNPIIYEVKASRADFLADVRAAKWRAYRPFCSAIYFATPDKLIDRAEVPEGAGLIVRRNDHWRRVVTAPLCPWQPSDRFWLTLLVRGRDPLPWDGARPAG